MKWPWVSRALLTEVVDGFRAQVARLEADRAEWRALALTQIDRVATMRDRGFHVTSPAKVSAPPPAPEVEGLRRAEMAARKQHFLNRITADLASKNPRLTSLQLQREAEKLWDATVAQDIPT